MCSVCAEYIKALPWINHSLFNGSLRIALDAVRSCSSLYSEANRNLVFFPRPISTASYKMSRGSWWHRDPAFGYGETTGLLLRCAKEVSGMFRNVALSHQRKDVVKVKCNVLIDEIWKDRKCCWLQNITSCKLSMWVLCTRAFATNASVCFCRTCLTYKRIV